MTAAAPQAVQPRLDFEVQEGLNINRFVREGNVAAHLLLRSGTTRASSSLSPPATAVWACGSCTPAGELDASRSASGGP